MRKKIFSMRSFTLFSTVTFATLLIFSVKANAYVEPGDDERKYKLVVCTGSQNGEIIMWGNLCKEGTSKCLPNPC